MQSIPLLANKPLIEQVILIIEASSKVYKSKTYKKMINNPIYGK